ncbi:MAG: MTH1187 family thiamine-binding protein [Nitrospirota bacterium]
MSVMVEFSVVPVGTGASLSAVVARVLQIVVKSGVRYKANPMGTVLEGSWEEVMGVVKKCHDEVMRDAERAVTSIKIDDRKGRDARIEKKLGSVEQKLGMKLNT